MQSPDATKEASMAANPLPNVTQPLSLDVTKDGSAITVKCVGEINSQSAGLLKSEVKPLTQKTKKLTLDLAQVQHLDSSGIGALAGLYVTARSANCELRWLHLNDRIYELLRLSKLLSVFEPFGEHL
jgi:anti-sigma B factor antagonist